MSVVERDLRDFEQFVLDAEDDEPARLEGAHGRFTSASWTLDEHIDLTEAHGVKEVTNRTGIVRNRRPRWRWIGFPKPRCIGRIDGPVASR